MPSLVVYEYAIITAILYQEKCMQFFSLMFNICMKFYKHIKKLTRDRK